MLRIDGTNAEALGLTGPGRGAGSGREFSEKLVWDQLKTIYDPEIPVNIVDLGLIYSCQIRSLGDEYELEVKMTLTAPGCGMSDVLKADVERKLEALPQVRHVGVEVVFDPPWEPNRMSQAARLQLGLDLPGSELPIYRQG
jgi:probable FeS assembly SUF system protein SufT